MEGASDEELDSIVALAMEVPDVQAQQEQADAEAQAKAEWRKAQRAAHAAALLRRKQLTSAASGPVASIAPVWSLDTVIDDPGGLNLFRSFCEETLADENLSFLLAVRDWRTAWPSVGKDERASRAAQIVSTYLDSSAPMLVSLPAGVGPFNAGSPDVYMFEGAVTAARTSLATRGMKKTSGYPGMNSVQG